MLDTITLDQLRIFITAVDEGNFSAAARKLRRVQSAVSQSIANLECSLGVALWDRSTKIPTLTAEGRALLVAARRVCGEADALRKLAAGMVTGIEASVSLCVDGLFPVVALAGLCKGILKEFSFLDLRVDTQPTSTVYSRVLSGAATLGIVSPAGMPQGIEGRVMAPIRMIPVVSAEHPLARSEARIPEPHFVEHVQVMLADLRDEYVPEPSPLRRLCVGDLATQHAFVRAGLGWGSLPEHVVAEDLRMKRLVAIAPVSWGEGQYSRSFSVVHRRDAALGPVHRKLVAELEKLCPHELINPIKIRRTGRKSKR